MELRQLDYFVAVAEEANFTRAAERVHISQSGVSAQIKQLERELGAELFDRSSRVTVLTAAGEAALEHARVALAAAQAVGEAVGGTNQLRRGRLAVGMVVGCTITPFFDALAGFHEAHPAVAITIREGSSDQLVDDVRNGAADLALVGCASRPPDDLATLVVVSERLVAVVPVDHPLARRRSTTLAQVVRHPMVCMPPGTGLRAVLDQACAARDLRPSVAIQAAAPGAIADLTARGFGIGILSASMAADHEGRLAALAIRDLNLPALLAIVWRRSSGSAARELADRCARAFGLPSHVGSRLRVTTTVASRGARGGRPPRPARGRATLGSPS
jgi:DNA-binding transcriptional LysR family regulator